MATDALARGEQSSVVLLRSQEDDVQFGYEQEQPNDPGAQSHAHAHCCHFQVAAEVDGNESDPNDTRRVHCKTCNRFTGRPSLFLLLQNEPKRFAYS